MTPVAKALEVCREVAGLSGGSMLVAFSGGKDSLCVLDLARQTFQRVEAFFLYLVPGLEVDEGAARNYCARWNVPLTTLPHWTTAKALKHSLLRFHDGHAPRKAGNMRSTELALHAQTGIGWTAWGWRRNDSLGRNLYLRQIGHYTTATTKLFPIRDWATRDVFAYLRARKIPLPRPLMEGERERGRVSGASLDPSFLSWLRRKHPRDYAKVLEVFPFADAHVWAYEHGHGEETTSTAARPAE